MDQQLFLFESVRYECRGSPIAPPSAAIESLRLIVKVSDQRRVWSPAETESQANRDALHYPTEYDGDKCHY